MRRRQPRSKRTDTLFPYTTLFRSLARVDVDVGRQHRVFGADARCPFRDLDARQLAKGHLRAAGHGHQDLVADTVRIVSQLARIAHDRAESLAALKDGGDDLAAQSGRHHVLHLAQGHAVLRSEEHTSELQSLMRISYAVFCLKQKTT